MNLMLILFIVMVKMMNEGYIYLCKKYHRVSLIYRKDKSPRTYRVVVEDEKGNALSVATAESADLAIYLAYERLL